MSISLDTSLSAQAINDILTQFNKTNAADKVSASGTVTGDGVVISIRGADGKTSEVTLTCVPELDGAEVSGADVSTAEELLALLDDTASASGGSSVTKNLVTRSVFCDLYQVMALLLEVAQKQREEAAKVRAQMHEATQASMMQQASFIRSTAETSFAIGLASCITATVTTAASIGCTIGSAVQSAKAIGNSGMKEAEANLATANKDMSANKATGTAGDDNAVSEALTGGHASEQTHQAYGNLQDRRQNLEHAEADLQKAEADLAVLQPGDPGVTAAETKVQQAKVAVAKSQAAYENACGAFTESLNGDIAKAKTPGATGGMDAARLEEAHTLTCNRDAKGVKGYYEGKVKGAQDQLLASSRLCDQLADGRSAQNLKMSADLLNTVGNIATKWFDTYVQKEKGEGDAKGREMDAVLDQERALTESAGEMFSQAQELIDSVRKLLMEITQAETDSVRSAIQA